MQESSVYVDGQTGDDNHDGTFGSPVKTIQAGLTQADLKHKARVLVLD